MKSERGNIIDERGFETLYRESYSRLYFYALKFLNDKEKAKDILSDVMVGAWNNRHEIEAEKMAGYLHVSLRNKCLNEIRRTQRDSSMREELRDSTLQLDIYEASWIAKEKRIEAIENEIAKMPERTQHILEQCYYNRHTYKEVAEEMGITTEGIKKQIARAMAQLRRHFNK